MKYRSLFHFQSILIMIFVGCSPSQPLSTEKARAAQQARLDADQQARVASENVIIGSEEDQRTKIQEERARIIAKRRADFELNAKPTIGLTVVPTMLDKITADSSWCGSFQLVWNDMKNEVVKQDIVFDPQEEMAANLNMEQFTDKMISKEYYYKKYGLKTLELKDEIERGIKSKFNHTSNIMGNFDWSDKGLNDPNDPFLDRYFFYAMLYRKFEYLTEFDKLDKGKFGSKHDGIEYFGIDRNTSRLAKNQITVLYYNSKDDFAIEIHTKSNDVVIFCKNPQGGNFKEIYDNMNRKSKEYTGDKYFKNIDEFKAPNLAFNVIREYTELQGKRFKTAYKEDEDWEGEITQAIQTIKFSLNEIGGEIISEVAINIMVAQAAIVKPRFFHVDDTFAIFLKENGQPLPYFAGKITDISKFQ